MYNILIVDDSGTTRAVIAKTLAISKLPIGQVHQAANGLEALELLKQHWIDLVLTDINMPEMNGMELVSHMVKDGLMSKVPVVVISTEGSATRIEELKQQGIRGYLRKPFTPEEIRDLLEGILSGAETNG